jgi:hypothetical protein
VDSLSGANSYEEYVAPQRKSYFGSLYMIVKGRARVVMKDWKDPSIEIEVADLRPGGVFGISDVLKIVVSSGIC